MTLLPRMPVDYREAGSVEALVQLDSVVDSRTLLTRGGDLLMVLKANPFDAECLDPIDLEQIARRFEGALRAVDDSFLLRQYLFKRPFPALEHQTHANPVVNQALAARTDYLRGRAADLFTIEVYWTVAYRGWRPDRVASRRLSQWLSEPRQALRQALSKNGAVSGLEHGLSQASQRLAQTVDGLIVQLQDVLPLVVLEANGAFRFLRRLLNYDPAKSEFGQLKYPNFLGFQAADSALECYRDHLRLDDHYVQILTLKEPPSQTFAHLLRELLEIRSHFVLTTEWTRQDNARMRRVIQSARRHFFNTKTSLASHLNAAPTGSPKDALVDTGAAAHVDALGACLEEIEVNGRHFGAFSLSVVLYAPDLAALKRAVAECFKVFAAHDARVIDERYNLPRAWQAVLPGNEAYNLRRLWLLNTHYADLSFLFTPQSGFQTNPHLKRDHLALLESDSGTPYYLNLHVQDVAHTVVLGATGSGKSFLLNFLVTFLQKYDPRTVIFDLGGGYRELARRFGGAHVPIGPSTTGFRINPFSLEPTPEHLHFLTSFVRVLIDSSGIAMTADDETDLAQQIEALYAVEPEQRRLLTLAQIVRRPLRAPLEKWVQGGVYARWFDNVSDTVTLAAFQTFDFEGMSDYPQVLEPLVFYILHRANNAINDPALTGLFKVFVLDEAWRFFRHPVIKRYVVEALKTWRKKNAALILATQSVDDLRQSELLPVVLESCPTQIFLANPGMDRQIYRDIFHLNDTQTERIANLVPKKQFLIKQPHLAKVLNLNVDATSHELFANNPQGAIPS